MPSEMHGLAGLADARLADAEEVRGGRIERFEHQACRETVAVAGGEKDDVDVRAVGEGVDGVAARADRLVVDVWRNDENTVLPARRIEARILLDFRVVGASRIEQ